MTLIAFPSSKASLDHMPRVSTRGTSSPLHVTPSQDARWYNDAGEPVLRVPYCDPKRKGETRPTTLADAKKLGLYPSTTTVLDIIDQPGLDAWQASQYIEAALTLDRRPGESREAFARRIVEAGEAYRDQARDDGAELHDLISHYLAGTYDPYAVSNKWSAHMRAFDAWWEASGLRCLATEHRFVNRELGYGGTVDCLATDVEDPREIEDLIIIDWKTRATEPGKAMQFYKTEAMQLAGYGQRGPRLWNVGVSRTEPGRIQTKKWGDGELHWHRFHAVLCTWKLLNGHFPGTGA